MPLIYYPQYHSWHYLKQIFVHGLKSDTEIVVSQEFIYLFIYLSIHSFINPLIHSVAPLTSPCLYHSDLSTDAF
jgi:hypothetical protein